jgi:CHAT domain-containing protein
LLKGHPGGQRSASLAALFSRGSGLADPAQVKQLPALPETATELRMLATSLGAGPDAIILRNQATETRVKTLDLKAARIVAFATHGLMAGDFEKVGEPSLVLTPPETASPLDDGLLTASEVTQLDLNADLVILSACNTAAPDGTPGAEGLSGLAKAFFYAGSRSLMVSHWPVASRAAVKLTTRMLADMVADPTIGRSEALRRSRMALMEDSEEPFYAHPMFWAPFVIVGEGGNI